MTLTAGSELDLAFGSYQRDGSMPESTADVDAQYQTRVAVGVPATPQASSAPLGLSDQQLIIVLLGIGAFALLLAAAVLLFWFVYGRKREDINLEEEN
jgi:hypothetical protein